MIEVAVGWRREFECAEADVIERLVVDAKCFVCILDKLMHRERRVVRLNNLKFEANVVWRLFNAYSRLTVSETLGEGTTE